MGKSPSSASSLAKTAKVISKYAEVVAPQPMVTKSDHEMKHGALVAGRNQLLELDSACQDA